MTSKQYVHMKKDKRYNNYLDNYYQKRFGGMQYILLIVVFLALLKYIYDHREMIIEYFKNF